VASSPESTHPRQVIRFGEFELDSRTGDLGTNGTKTRLQGQPLLLLELLLQQHGEVVTREQIRAHLWPNGTVVEFEHSVNAAVKRLREVLGDNADRPTFIETIPRRGYRFIAPLADAQSIPSKPPAKAEIAPERPETGALPSVSVRRSISIRMKVLIGAALLVGMLGPITLYWHNRTPRTGKQTIRSVAVLPLKNFSGDPSQSYLADGMTEALIGRLAAIHDLRVISHTSVMRFKDTQLPVPEIAKVLNVDAIVEGSVIREGSRIRVYAQLILAKTDEHFWSETYDRELGDVLSLQSQLAQAIANKVEITVSGPEHARLLAARHVAPEVYESYVKGLMAETNSRAEIEANIANFENAIRIDPTFAPAYVGLADAYSSLDTIFVGGPSHEMRTKVIETAKKALELDPENADAYALIASVHQVQWRWSEAEAEYKRALDLKPNNSSAYLAYSHWLLCQGRLDEALEASRHARELDPLGVTGTTIGWILFQARRYNDAIREFRSVESAHPNSAHAPWMLGFALIGNGEAEEAIPELKKTVLKMNRSPGSLELLATAYARAGHRSEALEILSEMKRRRDQDPYFPAGAFINPSLALNNYDEAFEWFERAYREQSNILQFLKVHPFFDPVRQDPRFKDLVHRVGLD
jgi:TolB-like protein/DNA-binding winged helix-turn-helix (wHTH) protein/cytochrome c-type biogenesis protein CcmH/NrfG